jgi:WD40 repeat protein
MITGDIRYILSASEDSTVRVWDLTTGYDVCFIRLTNPLTCMAKSHDNRLVSVGDEKGGVHIFELKGADS